MACHSDVSCDSVAAVLTLGAVADTHAPNHERRRSTDTLRLLARVVQGSNPCHGLASLPVQFANALVDLAECVWIRGESHLEHYYAEALTMACLRPASADIRGYELLLLAFIRFDRRHPELPVPEQVLPLDLDAQHCVHFIQLLRSQSAFQPLYEAASQVESYGAMARAQKKSERIILLSRELSGQALLARLSAREEMYLGLATAAA